MFQPKTVYRLRDTVSLTQIFECGQCFRWEALGPESYHGVAFGREVSLSISNGCLTADCPPSEFDAVWRPYLDLDRDYATIRAAVSIDEHTAQAVAYGAGLRILQQEPWETLCSFILSQCNNIPRIRGIIARLCARYGEELRENVFAFPTPERIVAATEEELRTVARCGYRAPYVLAAARAAAGGQLDWDVLRALPTDEAKARLMTLPGIGDKVASCVLLFGLGKLDAFPVDVWMRRTINAHYGKNFDPVSAFGPYAGIAQQYLFYRARSEYSNQ